jgi:ABC-type uncharacterized transport system involved in gliding motility auxiliary subunit
LHEAEDKLTALQSKNANPAVLMLTPAQEQEIEHFQAEKLRIRKQLRAVRAGLDHDISSLGTTLKILNIIVVPAVFALAALLIGLWRRRRRATPPATSAKGQAV